MTRCMLVAVFGLSMTVSGAAWAQSGFYGQQQINSLTSRNSTANYTTQQQRSRLINRTVPQYGFSSANRNAFSGILGSKPFSTAGGGGSVSPWLALSEPFSSSAHNYYTQVRPQLEQQRLNQQAAARNQMLQRQISALASQQPYSATGNENMAPTGHVAAFMNYGGYYTPVQPAKRQR